MRQATSFFLDAFLILLASFAAILLRDSLEFSAARLLELAPYLVSTIIASTVVLPLFGVNRGIWRFSGAPDYVRIAISLLVIVFASVVMAFAYNRLDGVPRSVPFLHFYLGLTFMAGARILYRKHRASRQTGRQAMTPLMVGDAPAPETLLLIGLSPLTEAYLQSVAELAPRRFQVAGVLGHSHRHVGRLVGAHKVLGTPEQLEQVLFELDVNGIVVDRLVVTASFASLSPPARKAIAEVEQAGAVKVQYLSEDLGFELAADRQISSFTAEYAADERPAKFEISAEELAVMQKRGYWKAKRAFDIAASLSLLILGSPLFLVVGSLVSASVGWPLVFRQQRPGLGGRPFSLYKFRTMGTPVAADGRLRSDQERHSRVGNFLRRSRLDELPQLFNILRGDMSFIGPRPLLRREQDYSHRARLLVRPGLSGWAQVVGGRAISTEDKVALDMWYVRHASFALDMMILLRTIPMIVLGEKTSQAQINKAWFELQQSGALK